jgi:hypothetical protein
MSRTTKKTVPTIPDAEDRLRHARETLALVAFIGNALATASFHDGDLMLGHALEADAFEGLTRLCSTAYEDLQMVHDNVMFTDVMDEGFKAAIRTAQVQGLTDTAEVSR